MTFLRNLTLFLAGLLIVGSYAIGQSSVPMCIPMVNGYPQGLPVVHTTTRYCHAYWLCNTKVGDAGTVEGLSWRRTSWSSCSTDAVLNAAWPKAMEVQQASAKVGTAHRLWREGVAFGCDDPKVHAEDSDRGRMCRERNAVFVANRDRWWKLPAGGEWRK